MPARVEPMMVTTATELPGYRIVRNIGIVRGIIVRSRSLLGSIGTGLQTIIGGNITLSTQLCEKTREDAYELMMQHAAKTQSCTSSIPKLEGIGMEKLRSFKVEAF